MNRGQRSAYLRNIAAQVSEMPNPKPNNKDKLPIDKNIFTSAHLHGEVDSKALYGNCLIQFNEGRSIKFLIT